MYGLIAAVSLLLMDGIVFIYASTIGSSFSQCAIGFHKYCYIDVSYYQLEEASYAYYVKEYSCI